MALHGRTPERICDCNHAITAIHRRQQGGEHTYIGFDTGKDDRGSAERVQARDAFGCLERRIGQFIDQRLRRGIPGRGS